MLAGAAAVTAPPRRRIEYMATSYCLALSARCARYFRLGSGRRSPSLGGVSYTLTVSNIQVNCRGSDLGLLTA